MRTLIYIPRMYSRNEFERLASKVPEDFEERSNEYWDYVEEKLGPLMKLRRIHKVYHESLCESGDEGLKTLSSFDKRNYSIVKKLIESGAELQTTEDRLLIAETKEWFEQSKSNPLLLELYEESMRERSEHIARIIDQTLKDGETGAIFVDSELKINLPGDIRVIRMCRFDPSDYLNVWLRTLELRNSSGDK
ncbi:MAG: hypothetical protein ACE5K4_00085 [Candidatus Hydrothermarchaeota archaeon]